MAGSSRIGLWITMILDRSWSCGPFLSQHSDHNNAQYHPDIDALDVPQVEKQDGYDLVLWQQNSTFHQHFLDIFQMDNCWAWMMFVFIPLRFFIHSRLFKPPKKRLPISFLIETLKRAREAKRGIKKDNKTKSGSFQTLIIQKRHYTKSLRRWIAAETNGEIVKGNGDGRRRRGVYVH